MMAMFNSAERVQFLVQRSVAIPGITIQQINGFCAELPNGHLLHPPNDTLHGGFLGWMLKELARCMDCSLFS